jgi:hypothetical protein
VRHARQIVFQLAEVAVPGGLFAAVIERITRLRLALAKRALGEEGSVVKREGLALTRSRSSQGALVRGLLALPVWMLWAASGARLWLGSRMA